MANRDNPHGFTPLYNIHGGEVREDTAILTTGSTCYIGDALTATNAGTLSVSSANDGVSVIAVAREYVDDSASAGGKTVKIVWVKDVVFSVQADSGTSVAATEIYETANHVATTGNTTTKISNHELDSSDIATGQQLRILGKVDDPSNAWGEHVDLKVVFIENALTDTTSI